MIIIKRVFTNKLILQINIKAFVYLIMVAFGGSKMVCKLAKIKSFQTAQVHWTFKMVGRIFMKWKQVFKHFVDYLLWTISIQLIKVMKSNYNLKFRDRGP